MPLWRVVLRLDSCVDSALPDIAPESRQRGALAIRRSISLRSTASARLTLVTKASVAARQLVRCRRSFLNSEICLTARPVALWLLEGQVLSTSELLSLCDLCKREPRLRIIVEMGGARSLRWQPLKSLLAG